MNQIASKIAGIILAAGEGKRIGGNKALIEIDGTSFLEHVAGRMRQAACDPLIAVGGSNSAEVKELARRLEISFMDNENWQTGQFSSLKAGLSSLEKKAAGAMIALVDHPLVALDTYRLLNKTFQDNPGTILIPSYNGRRGHPIIIPDIIINEVLSASPESNLREIIHSHPDLIHEIPVEDPGILRDIDSKADIEGVGAE